MNFIHFKHAYVMLTEHVKQNDTEGVNVSFETVVTLFTDSFNLLGRGESSRPHTSRHWFTCALVPKGVLLIYYCQLWGLPGGL